MLRPRNPMSREFLALTVGMSVSPLAFPVVCFVDAWLAVAVCEITGVELDQPNRDLLFLFARHPSVILLGYILATVLVFPPLMILRARGWLSGLTAIGTATWIPLTGAATMALLFGYLADVRMSEMLSMFGFLAYLAVPGCSATAVLFWLLYSRANRANRDRVHESLQQARST